MKIFEGNPFTDLLDGMHGRLTDLMASFNERAGFEGSFGPGPAFSPRFGAGPQFRGPSSGGPIFNGFQGQAPVFSPGFYTPSFGGYGASPFSGWPKPKQDDPLAGADAGGYGAEPGDDWGGGDLALIERQLGARGRRNPAIRAETVQRLSSQYGVPVAIILAILNQESGYGTDDNQLTRGNNFVGLTGSGTAGSTQICHDGGKCWTFALYRTPEEGLEAGVRNMAGSQYHGLSLRQYLALYLTGKKDGTDDGVGNTVNSYVNNALQIVRAFGGRAGEGSVVLRSRSSLGPGGPVNLRPLGEYLFPVVGYSGQVQTHHGAGEVGGTDLFAPEGTPVQAMLGGRVVYSGYDPVGGWAVMIEGLDGLTYYYAHLQGQPLVSSGSTISTGTRLGAVGQTGNAAGKGAHLHIGIGQGIESGTGPRGGAGRNFNAVEWLRRVLGYRPSGAGGSNGKL